MTKFFNSTAIISISLGNQFAMVVFQSNPEKSYSFEITPQGINEIESLPETESIGKLYHRLIKTGDLTPIK